MTIKQIEGLITVFKDIVKGRVHLFRLEFALAKYSIIRLLFFGIIFIIMLSSAWLMFNGLLYFLIFPELNNIFETLIILLMLNLLISGVLFGFLCHLFKQMQFKRTRKYFKSLQMKGESNESAKSITAENSVM